MAEANTFPNVLFSVWLASVCIGLVGRYLHTYFLALASVYLLTTRGTDRPTIVEAFHNDPSLRDLSFMTGVPTYLCSSRCPGLRDVGQETREESLVLQQPVLDKRPETGRQPSHDVIPQGAAIFWHNNKDAVKELHHCADRRLYAKASISGKRATFTELL